MKIKSNKEIGLKDPLFIGDPEVGSAECHDIREPLKTHLRENAPSTPNTSSSLLALRGLPGSGEVSSLRDRGADRQTSKPSEPFLVFDAADTFSLFKAVFRGTLKTAAATVSVTAAFLFLLIISVEYIESFIIQCV